VRRSISAVKLKERRKSLEVLYGLKEEKEKGSAIRKERVYASRG